ncbi:S-layer homology domain-containing protein [Paenibacillus sp. M1]|uniref:S-layer homology domain-containing protein n=1 Tax=Paenibacillus haidiansis TaxID=1574488 RepID=A0ABU7VMW6_9BACL
MKNGKFKAAAALLLSGSMLLASSASAFSDVQGQDAKITESLQTQGIIQGLTKDKFAPHSKLTGAQAVQMIVQALDLENNLDYAASKKANGNKFWYTRALEIAEANGIEFPKGFKWNSEITKEEFAYILDQAISATGDYPMIKMYIDFKDADDGNVLYSGSIQRLLLMKITELDEKGKFYPTAAMTRIEAARMVYNAAQFVEEAKENEAPSKEEVTFNVEKVNNQINKVVLTRHEAGNPGYGISVAKIEFMKSKAIIYYELLSPERNKFYPQVITDTKTETYVSSKYSVEIKELKD